MGSEEDHRSSVSSAQYRLDLLFGGAELLEKDNAAYLETTLPTLPTASLASSSRRTASAPGVVGTCSDLSYEGPVADTHDSMHGRAVTVASIAAFDVTTPITFGVPPSARSASEACPPFRVRIFSKASFRFSFGIVPELLFYFSA